MGWLDFPAGDLHIFCLNRNKWRWVWPAHSSSWFMTIWQWEHLVISSPSCLQWPVRWISQQISTELTNSWSESWPRPQSCWSPGVWPGRSRQCAGQLGGCRAVGQLTVVHPHCGNRSQFCRINWLTYFILRLRKLCRRGGLRNRSDRMASDLGPWHGLVTSFHLLEEKIMLILADNDNYFQEKNPSSWWRLGTMDNCEW